MYYIEKVQVMGEGSERPLRSPLKYALALLFVVINPIQVKHECHDVKRLSRIEFVQL